MAIQVVLKSDERGNIFVEKNDNGGGNVEFSGGSFWMRAFPSDVETGSYSEIVFEAGLFRGSVSPREIISFSRNGSQSTDSTEKKSATTAKA